MKSQVITILSRGGGMVDAVDLKSIACKGVRVRVPLSVPNKYITSYAINVLNKALDVLREHPNNREFTT